MHYILSYYLCTISKTFLTMTHLKSPAKNTKIRGPRPASRSLAEVQKGESQPSSQSNLSGWPKNRRLKHVETMAAMACSYGKSSKKIDNPLKMDENGYLWNHPHDKFISMGTSLEEKKLWFFWPSRYRDGFCLKAIWKVFSCQARRRKWKNVKNKFTAQNLPKHLLFHWASPARLPGWGWTVGAPAGTSR